MRTKSPTMAGRSETGVSDLVTSSRVAHTNSVIREKVRQLPRRKMPLAN